MPVLIRSPEESLRVDPENYDRGVELPPTMNAAEELIGPDAEAANRPPDLDALWLGMI